MTESTDSTAPASLEAGRIRLSMPPSKVTFFEDRAEVVRHGHCDAPGHREVVITDVSPLIAPDRTKVVAKLRSTGAPILVDDVRIEHVWVQKGAEDLGRVAEVRDALIAQTALLEGVTERLRQNQLTQSRLLEAYERWQKRTAWSAVAVEVEHKTWKDQGQAIEAKLLAAVEARAALSTEAAAYEKKIATLREMSEEHLDPERRLSANIVLRMSHATEDVELEIASRVPCALWRPTHEAHLVPEGGDTLAVLEEAPEEGEEKAFDEQAPTDPGVEPGGPIDFSSRESAGLSVQWTMKGALWQNTGEDWNDVEVYLSTERPSKGAVLPSLSEDRLQRRMKTAEERKIIQVEHRTETAKPNVDMGVIPGVYDGGEARHFRVPDRVTLKSDGRPKEVAVRTFSADVAVDRVAFPDESARVFRRAKLENPLEIPMLAGPVALRESGAFIGIGDLRYVGPLEKFSMSFGTDDGLVVRTRRYQSVESRRIAKDKTHFVTEVTLLSARAQPTSVDVILRWPVSELEQVKVESSPAFSSGGTPNPDADGLVHLPVSVPASGRKMVQLGFSFDAASGVNLPPPW